MEGTKEQTTSLAELTAARVRSACRMLLLKESEEGGMMEREKMSSFPSGGREQRSRSLST